jgi:stage II sporulation protein AA (anti-sigma F factor antagonist)
MAFVCFQLMEELTQPTLTNLKNIVLDCAELNYISSSGLRVFLIAQKKLMGLQGKLHLCAMQPSIKEIFDISGFSTIFKIFATEQEAIEA